jgi:hypothetical protein
MARRLVLERASRLAERQFGAVARRQLLEIGMTPAGVEHLLRAGRLHRRHPGVYAWGRPGLSEEGEVAAAVLHGGPGAALAGITALWWMDLLHRKPRRFHVEAPGRARSRPGVTVTHPPSLTRRWHRSLPVVPLPRALLVAARSLGPNSLRLVLARAEYARILDIREVEAALAAGRAGSRALRAALDSHLPQLARCANGLEREFVLLCERHRLPLPDPNRRIGRYRPDVLWRERRLIVELDGKGAHTTPAQLAADARRQADLERMGFTVIRFTWTQIHHEEARVVAELRPRLL